MFFWLMRDKNAHIFKPSGGQASRADVQRLRDPPWAVS